MVLLVKLPYSDFYSLILPLFLLSHLVINGYAQCALGRIWLLILCKLDPIVNTLRLALLFHVLVWSQSHEYVCAFSFSRTIIIKKGKFTRNTCLKAMASQAVCLCNFWKSSDYVSISALVNLGVVYLSL